MTPTRPKASLPKMMYRNLTTYYDWYTVVKALAQYSSPNYPLLHKQIVELTGLDSSRIRGMCLKLHHRDIIDCISAADVSAEIHAYNNKGWFLKPMYKGAILENLNYINEAGLVPPETSLSKMATRGENRRHELERHSDKWTDTGRRIGDYAVLAVTNPAYPGIISPRYARVEELDTRDARRAKMPVYSIEYLIQEGILHD